VNGSYPAWRSSYSHEELVEHFLLTPVELSLVLRCRGEANRCGMALLWKAASYLGYVPHSLEMIPPEVRTFVAGQLGLLWDQSETYTWSSRTRDQHLAQIRQHTGWRPATGGDKVVLEAWLREQAAYRAHTSELLFDVACQRFYEQRIELPTEGELRRLVNAALNGFHQDIHRQVAESLSPGVRKSIEQLLVVPEGETISPFERLTGCGKRGRGSYRIKHRDVQMF
jgi:hypothetical protein